MWRGVCRMARIGSSRCGCRRGDRRSRRTGAGWGGSRRRFRVLALLLRQRGFWLRLERDCRVLFFSIICDSCRLIVVGFCTNHRAVRSDGDILNIDIVDVADVDARQTIP
jgi:hypothetical protein